MRGDVDAWKSCETTPSRSPPRHPNSCTSPSPPLNHNHPLYFVQSPSLTEDSSQSHHHHPYPNPNPDSNPKPNPSPSPSETFSLPSPCHPHPHSHHHHPRLSHSPPAFFPSPKYGRYAYPLPEIVHEDRASIPSSATSALIANPCSRHYGSDDFFEEEEDQEEEEEEREMVEDHQGANKSMVARRLARRRKEKRRRSVLFWCWVSCLVIGSAFFCSLFITWISCQPIGPVISLQGAQFLAIDVFRGGDQTNVPTELVYVKSNVDLMVANPSKHFQVIFRQTILRLTYSGVPIASKQITKFEVESNSKMNMSVDILSSDSPLYGASEKFDEEASSEEGVKMRFSASTKGHIDIIKHLLRRNFARELNCDVFVNVNASQVLKIDCGKDIITT